MQILVRQREVQHDVRLEVLDQGDERIDVIRINLRRADLRLRRALELLLEPSHFDFVRETIMISLNSSEFWQHLWMATLATPPQPMIKAFPMVIPPEVWNDGI